MPDRIPAPDGALDSKGEVIMVYPEGTVIENKYSVSYLNTKDKEIILYLAESVIIQEESKGLFKTISSFFNKERKGKTPKKFIIKESLDIRSGMRLSREKEVLIRLLHPSIIKVLDFFIIEDKFYLVQEYVEGELIENLIKSNSDFISEKIVLKWIMEIIGILEYIHNLNPPVIHRGIKPDNFIITGEGHIKLIDVGLSRIYISGRSGDSLLAGEPGFAPPEQLQGTKQTDRRSDIYSLGATMHYLLTKHYPGDSPFNLPPVRSINPSVSENIERVIQKALQQDMENRFTSITEMKEAIVQ